MELACHYLPFPAQETHSLKSSIAESLIVYIALIMSQLDEVTCKELSMRHTLCTIALLCGAYDTMYTIALLCGAYDTMYIHMQ